MWQNLAAIGGVYPQWWYSALQSSNSISITAGDSSLPCVLALARVQGKEETKRSGCIMLRSLEDVQTPKFSNIKAQVFQILGNMRLLEHLPKENQGEMFITVEDQLVELLNIIDSENDKQQTLKALAFELANKI